MPGDGPAARRSLVETSRDRQLDISQTIGGWSPAQPASQAEQDSQAISQTARQADPDSQRARQTQAEPDSQPARPTHH